MLDSLGMLQYGFNRSQDRVPAAPVFHQFDHVLPVVLHGVSILPENLRISVAKPINGLVDIAHSIKPVRPAQQIHKLRLLAVGVLKFIQQPVVDLRVEPVVDEEPVLARRVAREYARFIPRQQQTLHVAEGQLARAPPGTHSRPKQRLISVDIAHSPQ